MKTGQLFVQCTLYIHFFPRTVASPCGNKSIIAGCFPSSHTPIMMMTGATTAMTTVVVMTRKKKTRTRRINREMKKIETTIQRKKKKKKEMLLFVGCLTSQQHASVSQGRICSITLTRCHTEIEAADQTFYLTQSQYTDTGPTSPSADPITPGAWQGSH